MLFARSVSVRWVRTYQVAENKSTSAEKLVFLSKKIRFSHRPAPHVYGFAISNFAVLHSKLFCHLCQLRRWEPPQHKVNSGRRTRAKAQLFFFFGATDRSKFSPSQPWGCSKNFFECTQAYLSFLLPHVQCGIFARDLNPLSSSPTSGEQRIRSPDGSPAPSLMRNFHIKASQAPYHISFRTAS